MVRAGLLSDMADLEERLEGKSLCAFSSVQIYELAIKHALAGTQLFSAFGTRSSTHYTEKEGPTQRDPTLRRRHLRKDGLARVVAKPV